MSDEPSKQPNIYIEIDDLSSFHMKLEAKSMPNIDFALNMIEQAKRVLECERRKQEALDFQAEQQSRMMDAAVDKKIRKILQ